MITTKRYNQLKILLENSGEVSNDEKSQVETYEFVHDPPNEYLCYVRRLLVSPGVVGSDVEVTTWTGQLLGKGKLGPMYRTGFRRASRRQTITFKGINGYYYKGTYFTSTGDYAIVRRVK